MKVDRQGADEAITNVLNANTVQSQKDLMGDIPAGAQNSYLYHVDQNNLLEGDCANGTSWPTQSVDISDLNK